MSGPSRRISTLQSPLRASLIVLRLQTLAVRKTHLSAQYAAAVRVKYFTVFRLRFYALHWRPTAPSTDSLFMFVMILYFHPSHSATTAVLLSAAGLLPSARSKV